MRSTRGRTNATATRPKSTAISRCKDDRIMKKGRDTIYVNVEYDVSDEEYGPVYIASNDELSLVTDGKTFEELLANLKEAIALLLEDDVREHFNLARKPRILLRAI